MNIKFKLLGLCSIIFSIFIFSTAQALPGEKGNHCYALISPANENVDKFSKILKTKCFENFSEALQEATNGRVTLDSSIKPNEVTNDILNSFSDGDIANQQVVIGIDWDYTNFGGSSYTWVVTTSGCSSSVSYNIPTMPFGWDNRVSSSKGYSNCNNYYHFQNTNFGG